MAILQVIGTFLLVLFLSIYWYVKQRFKYFCERNIPFVKPASPLGSLWRNVIFKESMTESMDRVYNEHKDKSLFGIFHGVMPVIVVTDLNIINDIAVKQFSHFYSRGFGVNEELNPLDNHLVNLEGNKWKTVRNKLSPTFTSGKMKGMHSLMEECVESFLATIQTDRDKEMKETFGRLTIHVIGSCAFGIDSDVLNNEDSEFFSACNKLSNPGLPLFLRTMLSFSYPNFAKAINLKTWPESMNRFFFDIVREGFKVRRNKEYVRNDFLQILLELKEKGEINVDDNYKVEKNELETMEDHQFEDNEKIVFDDELLTAQAFVFLTAGYETTATCLGFTLYLLSKNQWAQQAARKEIREVKQKYGSFTYQALKELYYLEACINESLRLYPPIGMIARKCTKQVIIDGVTIDKGTMIFLPVQAIHRDSNHFSSPNEFQPDRFLDKEFNPLAFLPFGIGPRICIGQRFAMMEMKLALAKLLDIYAVEPSPNMTNKEPIKMLPMSFVSVSKDGVYCILRKLKC